MKCDQQGEQRWFGSDWYQWVTGNHPPDNLPGPGGDDADLRDDPRSVTRKSSEE